MLCLCQDLYALLDGGGNLSQKKLDAALEERRRAIGDAEALKSQSKVNA